MRFIDFFAGVGGISLGLERAGHECVGHCEIDPYACKVLKKHWPDVPLFGDITKVVPDELPEAELWTGGFPCTDISVAGKQAGIHGTNSGLFFDWMRSVRVVRPKHMLMENVAALLHRSMGEVCGELAESGYDAEWDCIPASVVGAPHQRDRTFILADANQFDDDGSRYGASEVCGERPKETELRRSQEDLSNPHRNGRDQARKCFASAGVDGPVRDSWWDAGPELVRVVHGVPNRVDRIRCLGNAVVPQVAQYLGELLKNLEPKGSDA